MSLPPQTPPYEIPTRHIQQPSQKKQSHRHKRLLRHHVVGSREFGTIVLCNGLSLQPTCKEGERDVWKNDGWILSPDGPLDLFDFDVPI